MLPPAKLTAWCNEKYWWHKHTNTKNSTDQFSWTLAGGSETCWQLVQAAHESTLRYSYKRLEEKVQVWVEQLKLVLETNWVLSDLKKCTLYTCLFSVSLLCFTVFWAILNPSRKETACPNRQYHMTSLEEIAGQPSYLTSTWSLTCDADVCRWVVTSELSGLVNQLSPRLSAVTRNLHVW